MTRCILLLFSVLCLQAQDGGELRFSLRVEPKTFHPLLAEDESSETIRYLTAGVLIRLNRTSQELEPDLALKWKVSEEGRRMDFNLRPNVKFSDGGAFTCDDVVFTVREMMKPELHSPIGDSFRTGPGEVEARCSNPLTGMIRFPAPVAEMAQLFDQVGILPCRPADRESAVLGPYQIAQYKPGVSLALRRNPNYWKRDKKGRRLPYIDRLQIDIQQSRDIEITRFRRGETDMINKIDPELYDQLSVEMPKAVVDAGPAIDWEIAFFNLAERAPIQPYKKTWFQSTQFRRAVSEAINRSDLCRIVYRGHAKPASPISPANRFWANPAVVPHPYSPASAIKRLESDGFKLQNGVLTDRAGHRVEFSMITNSGNKLHERMLTLIQQDLSKIGIRLNVLTLDFASIFERIGRTMNYETCLMALANIGTDPNEVMNIWMSSGANHPWNPAEKSPATPWEAEIDKLMLAQNRSLDSAKRRIAYNRVQEIASEQAPMLFLVHPNSLSAVSPRVKNLNAAPLPPQLYWNIEFLAVNEPK